MKVNTITQFTPTCDAKMQITKQISEGEIIQTIAIPIEQQERLEKSLI